MTEELKKRLCENAIFPGNCVDCSFCVRDGDIGFVCGNRNSECYGEYSSGCKHFTEEDLA